MREQYLKAFAEVEQIIMLMPEGLQKKIPEKFKNIVSTWKDKNYIPDIKEPFEECNIMEETKVVLAIIYRDFLCSEDEKNKIKLKDSQMLKEYEDKLREKYNPEDIFKRNKEELKINKQEKALVEIKEQSFIKRLFEKIKHIFVKRLTM